MIYIAHERRQRQMQAPVISRMRRVWNLARRTTPGPLVPLRRVTPPPGGNTPQRPFQVLLGAVIHWGTTGVLFSTLDVTFPFL